jgi:hypothetical protein
MDEGDAEQAMAGLGEEFLNGRVGREAWCQRRELVWGGAEGLDLEVDVLALRVLRGLRASSRRARLVSPSLHGGPPIWTFREGLGVEANHYIDSGDNTPDLVSEHEY